MSALVFVYGTLKQGFPNHRLNAGRRRAGIYRTRQRFPLYVVRLANEERAPWLVDLPGEGCHVAGQVFELDAAALQALDAFEETHLPSGYVRAEIEVEAVDVPPDVLTAFAYLRPEHHLAACLVREGPFEEYTPELATGYRLETS